MLSLCALLVLQHQVIILEFYAATCYQAKVRLTAAAIAGLVILAKLVEMQLYL